MRTFIQPPPSSRCNQCGGELRLQQLKRANDTLDLDYQILVCAECGREHSCTVKHLGPKSNRCGGTEGSSPNYLSKDGKRHGLAVRCSVFEDTGRYCILSCAAAARLSRYSGLIPKYDCAIVERALRSHHGDWKEGEHGGNC